MPGIGILTFHRVYNYGAAIQAYALQRFLNDNGYENEIIDFSKKKQKDYTNVISVRNGAKRFIKTMMLVPVIKERIIRKQKFDDFFKFQLRLSDTQYIDENSLKEVNEKYDVFLIGSDQVWNIKKNSDFSLAYFLDFAGNDKKRITYAPSIGIADYDDLIKFRKLLQHFDALSCREAGGTKLLRKLTGKDVTNVLDPTLLVAKDSLLEITKKLKCKPYILYYSLDGYDKKNNNMDLLKYLSDKYTLDLKIITPEWPFHKQYGTDVRDVGPEDFLSLIRNAVLVCTNSFHGTALALKFERPLYVLENINIKDERKRSILEQVNAADRIISSIEDLKRFDTYKMDYEIIREKMNELEQKSRDYLINALNR